MLALDSTIGCLEASEAEVLDLYRSAPISLSSSPGARAEATEAYLCAIKKKTLVKVYLAFVVNDHRIYVYTSPGKGKSEQEYPESVAQVLGLARAMGFSLERTDLSYSPAMREVVVRNTKILRLPGTKAKSGLKHGLPGAPVIPLIPQAATTPIPAAATTATGTGATKTESSELRRSFNELKKKHQAVLTERDGLADQFSHLAARHEELAGELASLKERYGKLSAESEALVASRTQVDELLPVREQLTEAQEQVAAMTRQLEVFSAEREGSAAERDAMVENLARARHDLAQLTAARDSALESVARLTEQNLELVRELDAARREREDALRHVCELEQEKQGLGEELAALRQQSARSESAREALEQRLAAQERQKGPDKAELEGVQRDLEELTSEKDALLAQLAAQQDEASAEIESLRRQLDRERDETKRGQAPAEKEHPASDDDRESCSVPLQKEEEEESSVVLPGLLEKAVEPTPADAGPALPPFHELKLPSHLGQPWLAGDPTEANAPPEEEDGFPSFGDLGGSFVALGDLRGDADFAHDDGSPVRFMLETSLNAIDCPAAEEVLELYHSINSAYLSPEGTGGQESCQGYICCLRRKDRKDVFAAIYGMTSRRTWVYLPETQPRDEEGYARTVRSAISFAEEVGLMMEPVPLEASGPERQERLKRCPALKMAEKA